MADAIFQITIDRIAAGGAAFARFGGKSVFVEGCAAGERVCCRVTGEHGSWARAELLEIIEASPDRVEPACALYGVCGGCNMQHINYEAQLAAKIAILKESFARIGGFTPPEPAVVPSAPWEYRNRMQFHRGGPAGGFALKGRKNGGLVPVSDCPVADPGIRRALGEAGRGRTRIPLPPEKDRFTVYARKGLLLSEGGTPRGRTRLLDREITLDAEVFFQSNGGMLEKLIEDLRETAAAADRDLAMADLFCGVGTFAAFLADFFPRAELVEENKKALALARENLAAAAARTEFFALRDTAWAKLKFRGGPKRTGGGAYGFMVVDPPRQGLGPETARYLAADGPALLAYVSCDPASLARDSKILIGGGYELARLGFYDFYPQTAHIESLAVFNRKG
jgi:23S rRNA (uracil1939-C5)-methyltransferase